MAALVEMSTDEGVLYFEGAFTEDALRAVSVDDRVGDFTADVKANAGDLIDAVKTLVVAVASGFESAVDGAGQRVGRPQSITAEFGLSVSGEGRLFVAKASASANINIKATWQAE